MRRLSTTVALLVTVSHLPLADRALAQTAPAAARDPAPLEDAARLTWRLETRADGIAALRTIVSAAPGNADARFELGRVLTWDVRTRAEGVSLLEGVIERQPARTDVAEALAEVLAWDPGTRAEAIQQLRDIVQREPGRSSARLTLADVLSWNPATREESRTLYLSVLHDEEESVEAAVGLARVLSWSGRIPEARAWYQLALARNPDYQAARVGVAELEGWNGRARSSLKTLSTAAGTMETPDAFRLRAQAYSQIGRPARALEQYEHLLTLDPANTVALDDARALRRGLRPSLEIGAEVSTESGDPASSKVETTAVPLRFVFHPKGGDTEVSMTWAQASYQNSRGSRRDRLVGAGVDAPIGNRVRLDGSLLVHALDDAERTFTGSSQLQIALHDGLDVRVGVAREQLSSSRLSLAGEWVDGTFYGPSFVNQIVAGAGARASGWDVWAHGTAGQIRGVNIGDNARRELFAGAGKTFHPGAVTLRPGYSLAWMSYDVNLGAFPGDVAGDGITAPGLGGYFSPARFLNQMARVDVTVPAGESFLVIGGAGIGRQRVEESLFFASAPWTTSSDAVLGFRARVHDRMSIGMQATYQNVASAFDRTTVRLTLTYGF